MTTQKTNWEISGEYFENCNCDVLCPCLVSPLGMLQARPTKGFCDVYFVFHINEGRYGDTNLAGLNVALAAHVPDAAIKGNWACAAYLDSKASPKQQEALGAIFTGAAGGPMSALAPLIGQMLGAKVVPITFQSEGKKRSATIPNILEAAVQAVPTLAPDAVITVDSGYPIVPKGLVAAYGVSSKYNDYNFHWDNTGKNSFYGAFKWSGA
ncbi:MAG: DUF1326 domain-containing protein [Chloroflexi bacterium]|nr:DUF1326 domain-containing protein [Chloroflexota bacterium]